MKIKEVRKMRETLLSWAIARNAAGMSNQQLSDFIFENKKVRIDPQLIQKWRRGDLSPQERILQDALAYTFGYDRYSHMLIPNDRVAMSVMIVGSQMGMSADRLRAIRLSKAIQHKLSEHMRLSIDITGAEASAIGVAVEFWTNYTARPHPIEAVKMKLISLKERSENE